MHSDVLAHSGVSSLGAMWVQGSPWESLGGPLGVLGGSFWIPCGGPMRQTLRTPTFQRFVFFVCFQICFFQSCQGGSASVFTGAVRLHMLCTPMKRAYSRARFGSTRLGNQRASMGLSGTSDRIRGSKLSKGEYKVLDLLYLSLSLSLSLSIYIYIYMCTYVHLFFYITDPPP